MIVLKAHLITGKNITVNYNGETHTIPRTSTCADKLIDAIKTKNWDLIPNLISQAKKIETFSEGTFQVRHGLVYLDNEPIHAALSAKIIQFADEDLPYAPLVAFAKRVKQNPSFRAVTELFQFLEKNDHPITEDGKFIAYKKVATDFLDIHSRSMDNSVGKIVSMPRNKVDEDPKNTCSHGLHVANWDYAANHYGSSNDVMLEVEVDPANVVAVPKDYSSAKMRVCEYKVLSVVTNPSTERLRTTALTHDDEEDYEDEEDDDWENDDDEEDEDWDDEESSSSEEEDEDEDY